MGPSGPGTLALLVLVFVASAVGLARLRHPALRVGAGLLAFAAAATFGISSVNAYYDYYQAWGDLLDDVASDHARPALPVQLPLPRPTVSAGPGAPSARPSPVVETGAWTVERVPFPGPLSGVQGRRAFVLLPPVLPAAPLPVLVLLHGEPGGAYSWLGGLRLASVLQQQSASGRIPPMAVVLPDVQGFHDQQCLDAPHGLRLATYLADDVPRDIAALPDVAPPGARWAVGGLSEGGFCASTLILHRPELFSGAAVLDGYFHPDLPGKVVRRVYAGRPARAAADDPTALLRAWPATRSLPRFWLMAGTANATDYRKAITFGTLLSQREPVRLVTVAGGRHTTPAWRAALPDLLRWCGALVQGHPYDGSVVTPLH